MRLFKRSDPPPTADTRSDFEPGDAVHLLAKSREFPGRVMRVEADGLWIAFEGFDPDAVALRESDALLVSSPRTGMRGYFMRIEERDASLPGLLRVVLTSALGSMQRRKCARVPDGLTLLYRIEGATGRRGEMKETLALNVSGEGLLASAHPDGVPNPGDILALELHLSSEDAVFGRGLVVRKEPTPAARDRFRMGIHFVDMSETDQNRIMRRVFARQVQLRKAGLL